VKNSLKTRTLANIEILNRNCPSVKFDQWKRTVETGTKDQVEEIYKKTLDYLIY
jgi:hypothetical protein